MLAARLTPSVRRTARKFLRLMPILLGMLLLTSLAIAGFSEQRIAHLFGTNDVLDALTGASIGSIAAGHPLASYLLGGELLKGGASLVAVTSLLVSWVTVGVVQLPAEALLLGTRFALYRNLVCFLGAMLIAIACVETLALLD